MTRKQYPPLDLGAVIQRYKDDRQAILESRSSGDSMEAERMREAFDNRQRSRARKAAEPTYSEDTRLFLVELAMQLRDGWLPHYEARKYLSDALIAAAKQPDKAAHALGLVAPRKRPSSTHARDIDIAFRIFELSEANAIHLSAKGESAIEIAAAEWNVSADVAEAVWKEHGQAVKAWVADCREVNRDK